MVEMFPKLLYLNTSERIDYDTLKSINLIDLIKKYCEGYDVDFLIESISKGLLFDKIKYAQQVFVDLENDEKYNLFKELYFLLLRLKDSYKLFLKEENEVYKYFYLLDYFSIYFDFLDKASRIKNCFDSELINRFSEYFCELLETPSLVKLKNDLDNTLLLIKDNNEISLTLFNYNDSCNGVINATSNSKCSLSKKLFNIAVALNIDEYVLDLDKSKEYIKLSDDFSKKVFDSLDFSKTIKNFYDTYVTKINENLFVLIDQMNYYLVISRFNKNLKKENISFVYPNTKSSEIMFLNSVDLSLLIKKPSSEIVKNDILFNNDKRVFLLTGKNSGGKTTYLRSIGICLVLALAGSFVPASMANITDIDKIYLFFQKNEEADLSRFEYELKRIDVILENCNERTLLLSNEMFSSTTTIKALEHYERVLNTVLLKNTFAIFVTHNYDMVKKALVNSRFASLVAQNGYKVLPMMPSYNSHSYEILKKHGLTKEELKNKRNTGV